MNLPLLAKDKKDYRAELAFTDTKTLKIVEALLIREQSWVTSRLILVKKELKSRNKR